MEAVKTLLSLQQGTIPASVRLGAARAVLELGVKVRESAELEERIAALEAQLVSGTTRETSNTSNGKQWAPER